jgi:hypothetical protein
MSKDEANNGCEGKKCHTLVQQFEIGYDAGAGIEWHIVFPTFEYN